MTPGSLFRTNRIATQIALVVVVAMLLAHAITTTAFFLTRDRLEPRGEHPDQIVALVQLLDVAAARRPMLLEDLARAFPRAGLREARPEEAAAVQWDAPGEGRGFGSRLPHGRLAAPDGTGLRVAFRVSDGAVFLAQTPPPGMIGPFTPVIVTFVLSVVLLGWWASAAIARPLRAFERSVAQFSENMEAHPLSERGPREIRTAAIALNRMQARIRMLVSEHMRMLAALSHDLRTPLTRLRLRAEFVADPALQQATLSDVSQMEAMVEGALAYLRDGMEKPAIERVDLATILQGVCSEFADLGENVVYEGPDHAVMRGAFQSLQRAFTNLIDNAVRYGGRARVTLALEPALIRVAIADDGPGLAEAMREAVLEPFVRGDAARGLDRAGGFGLGLPIARAAILRHGGRLELANREPGEGASGGQTSGLIVRIVLPRAVADPPVPVALPAALAST